MKYLKPHFYDKFICTAGDCPDTCCAGWQIMIDEESLERYENEPGEFGKILRNSIDWEEECFYQNNRRCAFLNDENLKMATVKTPMKEEEKAKPGNVKVITDKNGYALYFSRSLIPYPREDTGVVVYKHIGIYGYRRDFLLQYAKMQPTPLEQTESLEQLRALENGYKIKVIATDKHFVGVDTKEDLEEVNKIYQEMEKNK